MSLIAISHKVELVDDKLIDLKRQKLKKKIQQNASKVYFIT